MQSDKKLLALLDRDPETGMEELVTQYNGLLWSVAARRLGEPEDIKDCVNETFLEFYVHRDRFAPDKGSLKNYLSAITDRLAIKRYWELSRCAAGVSEETPDCRDFMACADSRADLESALEQLEPLDAEIIRMKYYGGMTFKEIAASLDIPYETAKKRHQRSLKKLKKSIIIGLVVALLVALLAACAYVVLRYFGVVPGYGVNTNPETGIYILEETASLDCEEYDWTVTDAWWSDGVLILDATFTVPESAAEEGLVSIQRDYGDVSREITLSGLEEPVMVNSSIQLGEHNWEMDQRMIYRGNLPEGTKDTLEIMLTFNGDSVPITLKRAENERSFEQAGYYDMTGDQGGLLAIPRLENGELIVSIYPLNEGDLTIDAGLTKLCGELAPVTVTSGDGTVLTGSPIGWHPFGSETYFDWNFGPAEPGAYTLTVPYVYELLTEYARGTQLMLLLKNQIGFSLQVPDMEETKVEFPYGSVTLKQMEPTEPYDICPDRTNPVTAALGEIYDRFSWWTIAAEWTCTAPDRELANVFVSADGKMVPSIEVMIDGVNTSITPLYLEPQFREVTDPETGWTYEAMDDLLMGCYEGIDEVYGCIFTDKLCYRWDHEFVISFEVSETE